jgi:DNA-binding PadR family transcriptional regulator
MERDGLIERERCPQDARRTVVRATSDGLAKVQALSQIIEAHYVWMEQQLGKTKLTALYNLLDQVIALEVPAAHLDAHSEAHALNDVNEDAEALDLEAIEK